MTHRAHWKKATASSTGHRLTAMEFDMGMVGMDSPQSPETLHSPRKRVTPHTACVMTENTRCLLLCGFPFGTACTLNSTIYIYSWNWKSLTRPHLPWFTFQQPSRTQFRETLTTAAWSAGILRGTQLTEKIHAWYRRNEFLRPLWRRGQHHKHKCDICMAPIRK